jgi:FkbM family methyltransferase
MKLNFREVIWCFLFKIKLVRLLIFYNNKRYKKKLNLLNNLKLNKNCIVIDIGANNGVVSYYLFDKYSCYIHVFEPNPYCYEILKNIFKNNPKIKIYNKAVSNTSKKQNLYFSKKLTHIKNMSLSEISSLEKKKTNISLNKFIEVECLCIDELINRFDYIDFIKIDIEGHEYKVIPSLIKNINKIKKIFCEMHGSSHREEFKQDFKYWDKKLKTLKNKKFIYW